MTASLPETRPGESFRRLLLHLPNALEADARFASESLAATLKRSHAEAITLVTPASSNEPYVISPDIYEGEFTDLLMATCRQQEIPVEKAASTGLKANFALHSFANRPALEAACYSRVCRGLPLTLEDTLSPTGTLDSEAYRLLSVVFDEIAFKERWCRGAQPLVEVGVLSAAQPTSSGSGAARILQAGGYGFELLKASADFTPYRVLILPEDIPCTSELKASVQTYLEQGGSLLAAFETSHAAEQSGYGVTGETLVLPDYGLIAPGVGQVTLLGEPHFRSYAQSAGTRYKQAVLEALKRLLPDPLLRHDGPGTLEAIVTEQAAPNRWILHLLHYLPMGMGLDSPMRDDILPVHEVKFSLKMPKPVKRVVLRPQHHDALDFWEHQGRVEFVVPKITGHRMVSIEMAP